MCPPDRPCAGPIYYILCFVSFEIVLGFCFVAFVSFQGFHLFGPRILWPIKHARLMWTDGNGQDEQKAVKSKVMDIQW